MIKINKGAEPIEWTRKKATPGFTEYEPIEKLREALLKEQGYICAYCMREIPVKKKDSHLTETSKIEHIKCREHHSDLQLDYSNMVICCPGFIDGTEHCDKSKDNQEITFNIFHPSLQNSISYLTKDGTIKSSDPQWNSEIENILKLNNSMLKVNRKDALEGVISILEKKKWRKAEISSKLDLWKTKNTKGKHIPYCGIVIWFLEKKVRLIS